MSTTLTGRWGEAEAAKYLRSKKYEIIGANYHTRYGEIDLIVRKNGIIVFVEVKMRKSDRFAKPMEFVGGSKIAKLRTSAQLWLAENPVDCPMRFDVIEIYAPNGMKKPPQRIEHIENAFE